ncbi:MAG TPA: WD40 repeat domain-containing protein [bacterium]|nr:WD40 repeat domain-containing protein [bacterium]
MFDFRENIGALAISPDGQTIATSNAQDTIYLWSSATGKPVQKLWRRDAWVQTLLFTFDNRGLISGSLQGDLVIWDIASRNPLRMARPPAGAVNEVALSPDGRTLAVAAGFDVGDVGEASLWDLVSLQSTKTLCNIDTGMGCIAYNTAGTQVAYGWGDAGVGTAQVWDLPANKAMASLSGHTFPVRGVAFHPAGALLATSSNDGSIRMWDIATAMERSKWLAPGGQPGSNQVPDIDFTSDGRYLASGCYDSVVRIWDVAAGTLVVELPRHEGVVDIVAFSSGDQRLISSGSVDGTILIWDTTGLTAGTPSPSPETSGS